MRRASLLFDRPAGLEATRPPRERDGVRLVVTTPEGHAHAGFTELPRFLREGDLLVVNESATLPASITAGPYVLNVSTRFGPRLWLAEPRIDHATPGPVPIAEGDVLDAIRFVAPYPGLPRLWFVTGDLASAMDERGRPIRYAYVDGEPPLDEYQTIFARLPGSAEMPSAGRPFSERVVRELREKGVELATVVLHTGLSSHEVEADDLDDQPLPPEPFEVPQSTADAVNAARARGSRVVVVGTTAARALESVVEGCGIRAGAGFTRHLISPDHPVRTFDGLVSGLHDPVTSHLALLYAVAGEAAIRSAYAEAIKERYLWHEFGDSHLILTR